MPSPIHHVNVERRVRARDPERGRAAADALRVRFVAVDITDDASVVKTPSTTEALDGLEAINVLNIKVAGNTKTTRLRAGDGPARPAGSLVDALTARPRLQWQRWV